MYECTIYCSMYLPLGDDKDLICPRQLKKEHWKSETKFRPRQNLRIFFQQFFSDKKSQILSQTEFCLRPNFVSDLILSQTDLD